MAGLHGEPRSRSSCASRQRLRLTLEKSPMLAAALPSHLLVSHKERLVPVPHFLFLFTSVSLSAGIPLHFVNCNGESSLRVESAVVSHFFFQLAKSAPVHILVPVISLEKYTEIVIGCLILDRGEALSRLSCACHNMHVRQEVDRSSRSQNRSRLRVKMSG